MKKNFNKGFTLIELLVVIAILAILAAIALTSYQSAQKSARDGRRRSDLEQYRIALQNYAINNKGVFPFTPNCASALGACAGTCTGDSYSAAPASKGIFGETPCPGEVSPTYLSAVIKDPLNTNTANAYHYIEDSTGSKYVLYTQLENGTTTYWVVCSDGRSGSFVSASVPNSTSCSNLQ